jgi:hypothetical protein
LPDSNDEMVSETAIIRLRHFQGREYLICGGRFWLWRGGPGKSFAGWHRKPGTYKVCAAD